MPDGLLLGPAPCPCTYAFKVMRFHLLPADPSLIRQVAVKHFAKFHDRPSIITVPENTYGRRILQTALALAAA